MDGAYYQFKVIEVGLDSAPLEIRAREDINTFEDYLNLLGREGWSIAGISTLTLYMQRLVVPKQPAEAPPEPAELPDDVAEALCGCGCGETILLSMKEYQSARARGFVWYLCGHGHGGSDIDGPYMAMPKVGARMGYSQMSEDPVAIAKAVKKAVDDSLARPIAPVTR